MKTKLGLILAGAYVLMALYLIVTQGLFGESFIAILLGMPWTLLLSAVEFFGTSGGVFGITLLILPMVLNAYLLYLTGNAIGRRLAN